MLATLLFAVPLALVWMVVTSSISLESFFVGTLIGIALQLLLFTEKRSTVRWQSLPDQLFAFGIYTITLGRDVVISSLDVTRRVLSPTLQINPGILAVPTQDARENDVIAAFSAHGITLTPGELVMDFDGGRTMYVHALDIEASAQTAPAAQTKRLNLLRRITGAELEGATA